MFRFFRFLGVFPTLLLIRRARQVLAFLLLAALLWSVSPFAQVIDFSRISAYAHQRYGAAVVRKLDAWNTMLTQAGELDEQAQLRAVNNFWNQSLIGGEDIAIWGQADYWATPLQSLAKGEGDCEDYVIGKYFSLLQLGVPADKLRFVYVKAQVGRQSIAHMVLGYYSTPQAEPLVLDSLTDRIGLARTRPDLTPVFSFNAQGVYVPGGKPASVDRIGRWRDLLTRMQAEGFQP